MSELSALIRKRRDRILIRRGYLSLLLRLIVLALIAVLLFTQVFLLCQIRGNDMFPAVKDGDLAIVFRLQKNYVKNDVVIYTHDDRRCVGRIAAGPGDVVIIDETGTLLVNNTTQTGQILYPTYPTEELTYPYTVPEGCYFVLGDFRTRADDSRHFGAVPRDELNGKVITVIRRRGL